MNKRKKVVHDKCNGGYEMKKLLMMMLCLSMFTGCSRNNTTTTPNEDQDTTYNGTGMGGNDSTNGNNSTTPNATGDWYNRFETEMKNKNLKYSTKTSLDASTIGGAEGYRYVTDNGNVDIYRFEDGEDFKRIMKEKKVRLDDKDTKVEVNGNYIIVSEGLSNDVLDVFRGLR